MRWFLPFLLFLAGCVTNEGYTEREFTQARTFAYDYARGYLSAPDVGMPPIEFHAHLEDKDVPNPRYDEGWRVLAAYHRETEVIYLKDNWQPDLFGMSMLIHEHIHYLQDKMGKPYCRRIWEKQAFTAQASYLALMQGEQFDDKWVDWVKKWTPKGCS